MGAKDTIKKVVSPAAWKAAMLQRIFNRIGKNVNRRVPVEEVRAKVKLNEYENPPIIQLRFVDPVEVHGAKVERGPILKRGTVVATLWITTVQGRMTILDTKQMLDARTLPDAIAWSTIGKALDVLRGTISMEQAYAYDFVYVETGDRPLEGDMFALRELFEEYRDVVDEVLGKDPGGHDSHGKPPSPPPGGGKPASPGGQSHFVVQQTAPRSR